jgi:hypothetical protein
MKNGFCISCCHQFDITIDNLMKKSVQCQTTIPRSASEEEFSAMSYIFPIRHTNVLEVDASCYDSRYLGELLTCIFHHPSSLSRCMPPWRVDRRTVIWTVSFCSGFYLEVCKQTSCQPGTATTLAVYPTWVWVGERWLEKEHCVSWSHTAVMLALCLAKPIALFSWGEDLRSTSKIFTLVFPMLLPVKGIKIKNYAN